jgi:aquaporin Z
VRLGIMAEVGMPAKAMAEFIGTFLLVFTVTCNVFTEVPIFAGVSIAFVLMVSIYSLGGISGANFNPAVSLSLFATKLLGDEAGIGAAQFGTYIASQLLGGIAASLASQRVFNDAIPLGPSKKFGMMEAGVCEFIYSFMLCFVVLNVATAKKNQGNQYYGMAIGFVIIAGAYGAGAVSGGCFNPAVAWGLGATTIAQNKSTVMIALVYTGCECAGALVAAGAFRLLRPDNFASAGTVSGTSTTAGTGIMLISEFLGTFMLVVTVGLNVLVGSKAGAFSIAASLTSMIYALGSVSGAHFNPAVSTAIMVSGRDKTFGVGSYVGYMGTQIVAGMCAALAYQTILHDSMKLGPQGDYSLTQALIAEFAFTFVLAFVVLSVAVSTTTKSADMFGLAIGGCVTVGGNAIGAVSGGSLNPAVSFGIATGSLIAGGGMGSIMNAFGYSAAELAGGIFAAMIFRATHAADQKEGYASVQ